MSSDCWRRILALTICLFGGVLIIVVREIVLVIGVLTICIICGVLDLVLKRSALLQRGEMLGGEWWGGDLKHLDTDVDIHHLPHGVIVVPILLVHCGTNLVCLVLCGTSLVPTPCDVETASCRLVVVVTICCVDVVARVDQSSLGSSRV